MSVAGDEEMAEVQVLVEAAAVVQHADQAGHLGHQATLPVPEGGGVLANGGERDGLVQRQHAGQLLDGEKAAQAAPGSDVLGGGDRLRHGHALPPRPFQVSPFLQGRRPAAPGPQRRQHAVPPGQLVMPFQVHRQPPRRAGRRPRAGSSGRSSGPAWRWKRSVTATSMMRSAQSGPANRGQSGRWRSRANAVPQPSPPRTRFRRRLLGPITSCFPNGERGA